MNPNNNLKYYPLNEIANAKIHGRTDLSQQPLPLFWNGSAIEINATGTELWIEVEVDFDFHEPWVAYQIDGAFIGRQMLMPGKHKLCLFRNMFPDNAKNLRFYRELQAMSEDINCHILIHGFYSDGEFLPVKDRPFKIEFIGDSITSGEGTYGPEGTHPWVPMFMSASRNYAAMTADALNAEYRLLSQGGWGIYCGWDNDIRHALPAYYEEICSLGLGEARKALGGGAAHDFNSWQPDIVVINLGTNDNSAFNQPAWVDPETGISYKQRKNEDGSFHPEDAVKFEDAGIAFLQTVRKHNPNAVIVWVYGMLGYDLTPHITNTVNRFRIQTGDTKTYFLHLPNTTSETIGCNFHPGLKSHEKAAAVLTEYLGQFLYN
ncbi:MAG: GDSL family lipase [Lachnospiraceae bacterium]|nr:GDSL family lipase [Lachnospiraceae bacterium]